MYAVLPSQFALLGLTILQVGWLLSLNRLVRIPLNVVSGKLSDRLGPKAPYIVGLALGALSTLGYAVGGGFWTLLAFRAMWGVAWTLIVVAAYSMILDVSTERTRGHLTGAYASFSFFGGALGQLLGGLLVDSLGFSRGLFLLGGCTLVGCGVGLTLPHTRDPLVVAGSAVRDEAGGLAASLRGLIAAVRRSDLRLRVIGLLNLAHRFFLAGVFYATFGHFLLRTVGERISVGSLTMGVASLTAVLLFGRNVVTALVSPALGRVSDRLGDRSHVLLMGELVGVAGLLCFAANGPIWLIGLGVLLVAVAYGVVPPLLVAWIGDLTAAQGRGPILGAYQTMGDLGSGLGPLVAYPLLAAMGLRPAYGLCAVCLSLTVPVILVARRHGQRRVPELQ